MYRNTQDTRYTSEERGSYRAPSRLTNSSQDRENNVYVRSMTYKNSNNWRKDNSCVSDNPQQVLPRNNISTVNSFMPHFSKANYTPTTSAVDNLTPKFLQMHLKTDISHNDQQPGKNQSGKGSSAFSSWRDDGPSVGANNQIDPLKRIKQKFYSRYEITANDKNIMTSKAPLILEMLSSKSKLYCIMNKLDSITSKVKMDHYDLQEAAGEHLKMVMKKYYPDCDIYPYGIRLLGIAHPETAVYFFFDAGEQYFKGSDENKNIQYEIRQKLYESIKNCGECLDVLTWPNQEMVTYTHTHTKMRCVITFTNGFKHQNTLLLRFYLSCDKRLRLLLLLLNEVVFKYLDMSKFLTSYALSLLVIMYLQRIGVLPTLHQLETSLPGETIKIGEFKCFTPSVESYPPSTNVDSTEKLFKGFFEFYLKFNWEDDIVSIIGPQLKRSMFPKWNQHPVIVQDPFELSCNVAEKMNATVLEVFGMMCQDALKLLSLWC